MEAEALLLKPRENARTLVGRERIGRRGRGTGPSQRAEGVLCEQLIGHASLPDHCLKTAADGVADVLDAQRIAAVCSRSRSCKELALQIEDVARPQLRESNVTDVGQNVAFDVTAVVALLRASDKRRDLVCDPA